VLDRIAEWVLSVCEFVPVLFGSDTPHFLLIRAMFALLFIVIVVYVIAMRPFRSLFPGITARVRKRISQRRKSLIH
jgi:hypothetical protein